MALPGPGWDGPQALQKGAVRPLVSLRPWPDDLVKRRIGFVPGLSSALHHVRRVVSHGKGALVNWRTITSFVAGVVLMLLGLLWLLQGADLVHVRPILCVANCRPVTGGSVAWLAAGIIAFLIGLLLAAAGTRHLHRRA